MLNEFIGYVAVILHIWSFSSENRRNILFIGSISLTLYISHIYFAGSSIGVIIIASLGLISSVLGLYLSKPNRDKLIKFVPLLSISIFLFSGMDIMAFFAALGTLFSTYAKLTEDVLKIKIIYLGSASSWLIIGILIHSTPAILFDTIGISVLLLTIYNIKRKEKKT